jgi:tungstate transport system ATP-binding protein
MRASVAAAATRREPSVLPIAAGGLTVVRRGRRLIDAIDLTLPTEGVLVIMGPNGAGKSLLLRLLVGLVAPDSGTVTWAGRTPGIDRARRVGLVPQRPVLLRRTVRANLDYVLKLAAIPRSKRADLTQRAMREARLEGLENQNARLLSGGEQQRLALARTLLLAPDILLLDEPTASLDPASTALIEDIVRRANRSGTPVVLVTHDIGQARRLADTVMFLVAGRICESSRAAAFFEAPRSPEARAFLAGDLVV